MAKSHYAASKQRDVKTNYDYFTSDGSYLSSDDKKDAKIYVRNKGEKADYKKSIEELQNKSTEIDLISDLGTLIRADYAEMRGG